MEKVVRIFESHADADEADALADAQLIPDERYLSAKSRLRRQCQEGVEMPMRRVGPEARCV